MMLKLFNIGLKRSGDIIYPFIYLHLSIIIFAKPFICVFLGMFHLNT